MPHREGCLRAMNASFFLGGGFASSRLELFPGEHIPGRGRCRTATLSGVQQANSQLQYAAAGFVPDGVFCESASKKHECPNRRIKDHGPPDSIFLLLLTKCVSLTAIWSGPLQTNDRRGVFGQVWPPSMGKVNYQSCCLHANVVFFLES